ncbi:MAG: hypothetical protein AAF513_18630 [Pseudomonadota bacterium]
MKPIDGQFTGRLPTPRRTAASDAASPRAPKPAAKQATRVTQGHPTDARLAAARGAAHGDSRPVRIGRGDDAAIFAYTRHAQTASMKPQSSIDEYV